MSRSLVAVLLLLPAAALAGDEKDRQAVEVRYKAITEVEFGDLDVNARVVRPNVQWVRQLEALKFHSLVTIREDFAPEMKASVSEIR